MTNDDDMSTPVTRGELREEFASFEQRFEQRFERKLDQKFATKADLEIWAGALREETRAMGSALSGEIAQLRGQLSVDLARHTQTILDHVAKLITIVDEKYQDLPGRVTALETEVSARRPRRRGR